MEAKSVLEKSVAKAEKNNWNFFGFKDKEGFKWWVGNRPNYNEAAVLFITTKEDGVWDYRPVEVVYNHDFAKSYFGKDYRKCLKEMVVAKSVWEYLAKE